MFYCGLPIRSHQKRGIHPKFQNLVCMTYFAKFCKQSACDLSPINVKIYVLIIKINSRHSKQRSMHYFASYYICIFIFDFIINRKIMLKSPIVWCSNINYGVKVILKKSSKYFMSFCNQPKCVINLTGEWDKIFII